MTPACDLLLIITGLLGVVTYNGDLIPVSNKVLLFTSPHSIITNITHRSQTFKIGKAYMLK